MSCYIDALEMSVCTYQMNYHHNLDGCPFLVRRTAFPSRGVSDPRLEIQKNLMASFEVEWRVLFVFWDVIGTIKFCKDRMRDIAKDIFFESFSIAVV